MFTIEISGFRCPFFKDCAVINRDYEFIKEVSSIPEVENFKAQRRKRKTQKKDPEMNKKIITC